jgi:hypothetical protein
MVLPTPPKRRRKWFFAESRSSDHSITSTLSVPKNPFAFKNKGCPEIRFEFGSKYSHTFGAPVQSLHLDGLETTQGIYMPPAMSPIRKVSVEAIQ